MTTAKIVATAAIAAIAASMLAGCAAPADRDNPTGPCSVTSKDRSSNSEGDSTFLVYTDDCGVFTVDDAPLEGQWNATDTYNAIKAGKTYTFVTYGFRNGFLSSYPNILEAHEVAASGPVNKGN